MKQSKEGESKFMKPFHAQSRAHEVFLIKLPWAKNNISAKRLFSFFLSLLHKISCR